MKIELSAIIDNHIYFGNQLRFKKVIWKRCVDLNDRALREVQIGLSKEKNMNPRDDGFDISVASEIMAIFCLAEDLKDLKTNYYCQTVIPCPCCTMELLHSKREREK